MGMYYPRVNRGISFTRPGVYAFCLILLIGLIAVTTGINGLYVFLSAGLGGFIVSGLLSEQAIKSCSVDAVNAALADADTPFPLAFIITNSSSWFSIFSMQNLLVTETPRFRLIARPLDAVARARIAWLAPQSTQVCTVTVRGMARGDYQRIQAVQITTFPFGILEKFKLVTIPASILVAPHVDPVWHQALDQMLRSKLYAAAADQEFYSHRPYLGQEASRSIDWKKSANKPPNAWVVRQYRSPANTDKVRIEVPWDYVKGLPDASSYEAFLVRVRTALQVLDDYQRPYYLDFGTGWVVTGSHQSRAALALLPRFAEVGRGPKPPGQAPLRPSKERAGAAAATLQLTDTVTWLSTTATRGA